MVVSNEILVDLKGLVSTSEIWAKLKAETQAVFAPTGGIS